MQCPTQVGPRTDPGSGRPQGAAVDGPTSGYSAGAMTKVNQAANGWTFQTVTYDRAKGIKRIIFVHGSTRVEWSCLESEHNAVLAWLLTWVPFAGKAIPEPPCSMHAWGDQDPRQVGYGWTRDGWRVQTGTDETSGHLVPGPDTN